MFYLIGSRYFGTDNPESDHDYLGEDTPKNREFCERMGLKRVKESKWVKYHGFRVDVLLVINLEDKLFAREMAFLHCPTLPKLERHAYLNECVREREVADAALTLV